MIPTGQATWPDIFPRGVSRQRQIARARIHTSCASSTGRTGFTSVQAPGRKCEKLERWPAYARRGGSGVLLGEDRVLGEIFCAADLGSEGWQNFLKFR